MKEKKGWHCPYCSQICPRHWNMKVHIQRKHQGIGEPVEAPYNSVYIQNMDSLENKSDYFKHNVVFPFVGQTKRQESDRRDRLYGNRHFLAEESEYLRNILEMKNLINRLEDNRQRISANDMFFIASALSASVQSKNFTPSQSVPHSKKKPLGFCINVCDKCLGGVLMPILPEDFLRMKFSVKVEHTICSEEDISRISYLIENQKIEDIATEVKKIHDRLINLLTEIVYSWAGKDDIGLYGIEASSNIFSQEFRDNNASITRILDILASPWIEGNAVDLGHVKNGHWAFKLIKQNYKMAIIKKDELREFLNTSDSTLRAFKAQIEEDGSVVTRYFHVICMPTSLVNSE
ncbi:MAG: hypothetical protein WAL66_14830 [Nitrososphaeraceae archaeon]